MQIKVEKKREVLSLITAELLELEGAQHGDDLFFQDAVKERVLQFLQTKLILLSNRNL
jgi:hypothetical protein